MLDQDQDPPEHWVRPAGPKTSQPVKLVLPPVTGPSAPEHVIANALKPDWLTQFNVFSDAWKPGEFEAAQAQADADLEDRLEAELVELREDYAILDRLRDNHSQDDPPWATSRIRSSEMIWFPSHEEWERECLAISKVEEAIRQDIVDVVDVPPAMTEGTTTVGNLKLKHPSNQEEYIQLLELALKLADRVHDNVDKIAAHLERAKVELRSVNGHLEKLIEEPKDENEG